jgi:bifunctional aspartokinase / homoserine dehydrogenase 1
LSRAASIVPEVHKFGGASLATAEAMAHAVSIVLAHRPGPMVVVVSALAGVTDALLDIAASRGDVRGLRRKHLGVARALFTGARRKDLIRFVDEAFDELKVPRKLTPGTTDDILARGEQLSARLFAAALEQAGCPVEYVSAVDLIVTDDTFGQASADLAGTERAVRKTLGRLLARGVVTVVPGFIGATPDGQITTLGRGGSDLTATLLARALRAREVSLWKDVPGVLTADPRVVPDAHVVPQLHVREAAELAYYGAKVLHPRALIPLGKRNIAVRIRPFANPGSKGTEISQRRTLRAYPVKAISAIPEQALLTVTGNGMLGVPGIAARTFEAVHRAGVSVSLISQASSEHSICFSVPSGSAARARKSLRETFRREIDRGEIDGVEVQAGVAAIAIVGLGMAATPGIAARVFSALADAGINVVAIAQGSSELNLSVVVDGRHGAAAQRAVHAAFQLNKIDGGAVGPRWSMVDPRRTDIVLLGLGQIGRPLSAMISTSKRDGVALRVVGVIDRSGYVFDAGGLSARRLATLSAAKKRGTPLATVGQDGTAAEAIAFMAKHALANPVLVDVTADDTAEVLVAAFAAGMHVVLANKRPLTGPKRLYDEIRAAAASHGRQLRFEATVGAGLPVIATFDKLVESGDRVSRIEACPSGTLGYLFGELGRGRRFSEALRGAIAKGYTEPDPRDDLSGTDVARKALILGRLLGFAGELDDIEVESLVPKDARGIPLKDFLRRLDEWDAAWQARVAAARARGGVLRYRCIATRRSIRVGLVVVDASSPMASLIGTDNQFIFTTTRYKTNPLVITGPGAGPAVTAGGIVNDVLQLANG